MIDIPKHLMTKKITTGMVDSRACVDIYHASLKTKSDKLLIICPSCRKHIATHNDPVAIIEHSKTCQKIRRRVKKALQAERKNFEKFGLIPA